MSISISDVRAVRPGDPGFETVRHVYSAPGSPALVFLPENAAQAAVALAHSRALPGALSIRSGGHGISSIATNDGGTVIDLRHLDAIEHLGGTRVRIGAGARWGGVARRLDEWGLALTSGDSGDVGVGGLATTGGIGLLGRSQGLTIDRMRAAEVVVADGRVVRVAADEHPDLFWAVRGAGANVGMVTAFEFDAGTTPIVARATVAYELADPASFLRVWGDHVERSPREVTAFLYVGAGARPFAQATIVYADDDPAAAERALASFTQLPGVVGARAALVPYWQVPLTSGAPQGGQQSAVMHTALVAHLTDEIGMRMAEMLRTGQVQMVQIRAVGGAINDVPANATAYAHRHQNFSVMAVSDRAGEGFDRAWQPLRNLRDGIYLSFESRHRAGDVDAAFPPETLARLRTVKSAWDPDDVFSQNFDVSVSR